MPSPSGMKIPQKIHVLTLSRNLPSYKVGNSTNSGGHFPRQGENANIKEPFSGSAILGFPAIEGNSAMVRLLLDNGADIDEGLLGFIASRGHYSVAKLLINNGVDVNEIDQDKSTPLHHAAQQGHLPVAKLLIDKGANINALNRKGETPLSLAVRHFEMTKMFGLRVGQKTAWLSCLKGWLLRNPVLFLFWQCDEFGWRY